MNCDNEYARIFYHDKYTCIKDANIVWIYIHPIYLVKYLTIHAAHP